MGLQLSNFCATKNLGEVLKLSGWWFFTYTPLVVSELKLACDFASRSSHFFLLKLFVLAFSRFNLHWALSNRLSNRKGLSLSSLLHHLGHNPIGQGRFRCLLLCAAVKRNMYKSNKWLPLYSFQVCCVGRACSWSRIINYDLCAEIFLCQLVSNSNGVL